MSEDLEPIEKVEPPCQIYYLQSSSGKVYRCYRTSEADKVIAHHKRKRCLAMAKWCGSEVFVSDYEKDELRMRWFIKWHKIWLALAEEPTWAKFLKLIHKEAK